MKNLIGINFVKNYKIDEFTFGKYKGEKLTDINDVDYLYFILESINYDPKDEVTKLFVENLEIRINELEGF